MKQRIAWMTAALLVASPAVADVAADMTSPWNTQAPAPADAQPDFGTGSLYSSLDSFGMIPHSVGFDTGRSGSSGLFCNATSSDSRAVGQIHVPHGVDFDFFRVWGFDSSGTDDMQVTLERACLPDSGAAVPVSELLVTRVSSGTPGAFTSQATIPSISDLSDNRSCTYQVTVRFGNTNTACVGGSLIFYKVRIQWQREAPPAPAVATFTDVPVGAQFFREVEALAASGITLGCTATEFCPDNFVTRRQMAAFLVRALGLPSDTIPDPANP